MICVAPSILSADFSMLGKAAADMQKFGADILHIDVMDGHFVPNITIGPVVVKSLRRWASIPFDVHLMISRPLDYIDVFAGAGADVISFHPEAESDVRETIKKIKEKGVKPALAIKPATAASSIFPYLDELYMVLVMTVEPGFGGQSFMTDMLDKIRQVKAEIDRRGLKVNIEVDGGISPETAPLVAKAGANWLVAGSAVFNADSPKDMIERLRKSAEGC